jgi:hypothetical protein
VSLASKKKTEKIVSIFPQPGIRFPFWITKNSHFLVACGNR